VQALVRRAYDVWVPVIGRRPAPMDDDYAHHIAAGEVFVFEDGGAVAAVVVLIEAPDHLLLENVAVEPGQHGRGLGGLMIRFAEAEALRRGHGEVRLFTNELMQTNLLIYQRLGFVETHRATVRGFGRVFMTKVLRPPA
jgi:GNAT superfamily N-acetyltransferase